MKMLDCFCGIGGVSDGFAKAGFNVLGIDLLPMNEKGYKHPFMQKDFLELDGNNFKGQFSVIWGSPPCRDFSIFAKRFGSTWKKNPPNPQKGLILVKAFLKFVKAARPQYWIMENVPYLQDYLKIKPKVVTSLGNPSKSQMRRAFWGYFPAFLIPKSNRKPMRFRKEVNKTSYKNSFERAKIPLACSFAFAEAIKKELENNF